MASGADGQSRGESSTQPPLSWEGDRMFNIYIYDYCHKRGFNKTAHALMGEAEIPPDSQPPINAKQGLLFEWWSVFWVLFTAKSNGTGSDDALTYTQHQAQKQHTVRSQVPPQVNRMPNGMTNGIVRSGQHLPNGQMPNGVTHNGVPTAPGAMPNGTQGTPYHGGPQTNGMPGPAGGPGGPGQVQHQGLQQMQRAVGVQQRGPNGVPSYQSPTMAHSPQNPGVGPQQLNPGSTMGQMGVSQPLTQMNARGGMLPPNGPQNSLGPTQHTPQQAFQQLARSPSQPGSPAMNGHGPSPSPSMAARQPPGMHPGDIRQSDNQMYNDILRLPAEVLNRLRQEAGVGDKDLPSLTAEEKQRLLNLAKSKRRPGGPGPSNATAGPSMQPPLQRNPQMPPSAQQGGMQQLTQQQQSQAQQQQRGSKRNSTSPGQDQEQQQQQPRNDASPPDRKRMRRSPANGEQPTSQAPPMTPLVPFPPSSQPNGPGGPQMQNNMMRPLGGFPGQQGMPGMGGNPGMNMHMGPSLVAPPIGMNSGMMAHPGSNGMMNPQLSREQQYRQTMQTLHKNAIHGYPPGAAGSPAGSDGQFNVDGGAQSRLPGGQFQGGPGPAGPNRLGPNKGMGMLPPPSPSMNAAKTKEGGNGDSSAPNGRLDASPQNAAAGVGQSSASNSGPQGAPPAPPTPGGTNAGMTAPSPSSILSNPSNAGLSHGSEIFPADFLQSAANQLDDFDTSIFRPDGLSGDLNFERDFGEWFNPDNVGTLNLE